MIDFDSVMKKARGEDLAEGGTAFYSDRSEGPRGIRIPNSTQIPNELIDYFMASSTEAEFKVLMYITRKTFGYNKVSGDDISLSQLVNGTKRKNGEYLDKGTGLDKKAVIRATRALEKGGLLEVTRRSGEGGKNYSNHYRLRLEHIKD